MSESNFINKIGIHPTGGSAVPTLPNKGSNVASWSGWTVLGSIQAGDAADLDGENVEITFFDEFGEVRPPRSLTREGIVNFANGVDSLEITCYDGSEALLDLDSGISQASNVSQKAAALTFRTVAIEINGLWLDFFPSCEVRVNALSAGYAGDGQARTVFMVRPLATATVLGGWQRHHYQAA